MISLGKVLIMPRGSYEANATYTQLDIVTHNGTLWICKETAIGIEPTEENHKYWMNLLNFIVVNALNYSGDNGVLDARQGAVLKNLIDTKAIYETVTVTSGEDGSINIPGKDNYSVFSVMAQEENYVIIGNSKKAYVRSFANGVIGNALPKQLCKVSVAYVKKE